MNVHFWGYTLWPALWPTFLNYVSEPKCLDNLLTYISVPKQLFSEHLCFIFWDYDFGLRFDISISKYRTYLWSSLRDSFHIAHTYRPSMYLCILDVMIFVLCSDLHVLWIKHTFLFIEHITFVRFHHENGKWWRPIWRLVCHLLSISPRFLFLYR